MKGIGTLIVAAIIVFACAFGITKLCSTQANDKVVKIKTKQIAMEELAKPLPKMGTVVPQNGLTEAEKALMTHQPTVAEVEKPSVLVEAPKVEEPKQITVEDLHTKAMATARLPEDERAGNYTAMIPELVDFDKYITRYYVNAYYGWVDYNYEMPNGYKVSLEFLDSVVQVRIIVGTTYCNHAVIETHCEGTSKDFRYITKSQPEKLNDFLVAVNQLMPIPNAVKPEPVSTVEPDSTRATQVIEEELKAETTIVVEEAE